MDSHTCGKEAHFSITECRNSFLFTNLNVNQISSHLVKMHQSYKHKKIYRITCLSKSKMVSVPKLNTIMNLHAIFELIRLRGRSQITSRKKTTFSTPLPSCHKFSKERKILCLDCHRFSYHPSSTKA